MLEMAFTRLWLAHNDMHIGGQYYKSLEPKPHITKDTQGGGTPRTYNIDQISPTYNIRRVFKILRRRREIFEIFQLKYNRKCIYFK